MEQWCDRQRMDTVPTLTFATRKWANILLTNQEQRGKEKWENGQKKERCKREGRNLKMEGEKYGNEQRTIILLFIFWNNWNCLAGVYQNGISIWKSISHLEKIRKSVFPSKKYSSLYATDWKGSIIYLVLETIRLS